MNVKNAKQNITSQHSDILEYYAIWVKCHVLEGSRHIIHPREKIKSQNTSLQGMSYDVSWVTKNVRSTYLSHNHLRQVSCTLSSYNCLKFLFDGGMYTPNPTHELGQAFVISAVYQKCLFILQDARAQKKNITRIKISKSIRHSKHPSCMPFAFFCVPFWTKWSQMHRFPLKNSGAWLEGIWSIYHLKM